jgi:hypothetical protein
VIFSSAIRGKIASGREHWRSFLRRVIGVSGGTTSHMGAPHLPKRSEASRIKRVQWWCSGLCARCEVIPPRIVRHTGLICRRLVPQNPFTVIGTELLVVVPLPRSPYVLLPQH